jgi:membrane-associated phospholipid phosphatase
MAAPRVRPLLGDAGRTWAGIALGACVMAVMLTGLLFKGETGPDGFDNAVDSPVIALFRAHGGFLHWLALPGTLVPAIVISAATAAGCLIAKRPNGAVLAVAAVPAATGLTDGLLKPLFHRTYLGALSFPSGHTTSVTGMAATVALLLIVPPQRPGTRAVRAAVLGAACLLTVMVVIGVIGLRWHYFTDTVAGAAVGVGTVLGLALLLDLATSAVDRRRAGPPRSTGSSQAPDSAAQPLRNLSDGRSLVPAGHPRLCLTAS